MKNLIKIFLFVFILFQIFSGNGYSQSLLEKVQNKFNKTIDISADFAQYTNGIINLNGKLKFKQENKIRIELKNVLIISDGETNWSFNKKRNKIIISDVDNESPSIFSLKKLINEYPKKSNISERKEDKNFILKIRPKKDSGLIFKSAELYFNSNYQIKKIIVKGKEYGILTIVFTNYKENNYFKDSMFKITPSKGIETIDLR